MAVFSWGKNKMGKISPISIKYNIYAKINLTGLAERPDVIGAVFGQTEGLLGPNLELRELQKAGRIGRIEVQLESRNGKSRGTILIPSSMSKSETALVAAAVETIDRVGPSESKITIDSIKDVRSTKRDYIMNRAKELLKELVHSQPDAQEMTVEIAEDVRASDIENYGKDKLPGGPDFERADEVIIVEGRADVLNLLKYGIRNTIALNGAKVPRTLPKLVENKKLTLFVDGDRGGELITKNLSKKLSIDLTVKAPDGKEVEELTQKEILMALRGKNNRKTSSTRKTSTRRTTKKSEESSLPSDTTPLKELHDEIVGDGAAVILDDSLQILGRVPVKELDSVLEELDGAQAIVMDGKTSATIMRSAYKAGLKYIVASKKPTRSTAVKVYTVDDL